MKKLILVAFSIVAIVYSYGTENQLGKTVNSKSITLLQVSQDPIVVEINLADLPDAVKEVVANYEKTGWEASNTAYHVTNEETQSEHYEVILKNKTSGEKITVKISKEGEELK